jgi:hypothetical protein
MEDQNFRTRYRFNLFLNIQINQRSMTKVDIYTTLNNKLFIHGRVDIGSNRILPLVDRNRICMGTRYFLTDKWRG